MKKSKLIALLLTVSIFATCLSLFVGCNIGSSSDCTHVDKNNDGKCDRCLTSVIVDFDFYAINDIHGILADIDGQTGVGGLTTYLLDAQRKGNAYVLSSGDTWQGDSESNNTRGLLATEWLNYINCVSMTLGNHEFDWKTSAIAANAELASFPILAINVYEYATNERAAYCGASVMLEKDGAKIGIIGAIGDCYSSISASACSDVYFKVDDELTELVKAEATSLRQQGADYIIYSLHDGGTFKSGNSTAYKMDWYDTSLSNGYVDLVFEAHTHYSYVVTDSYGVYHAQAGGYNDGISHADISINIANGNSSTSVDIVKSSTYSKSTKDNIIDKLSIKYREQVGFPDEILGYNSTKRTSDDLCEAMAEAYYDLGLEQWGKEYDIVLGGGYIKARSPYSIAQGSVTARNLQRLFPFENSIMLCSIKGSDLRNRFFSLPKNYHIYYGSYGNTIRENLQNDIGLNETYYVVVDSYSADYYANRLTVVESLGDAIYPRDLLMNYVMNYWLS